MRQTKILLPCGRLRHFHVVAGPALSAGQGAAPLEFLLALVRVVEPHSSVLHPGEEHITLLPRRAGGPLGITGLGPKVLAQYFRQLPGNRHGSRERRTGNDSSQVGDPMVK